MNSGSNKVASAIADDILEASGATGTRTATASKAAVSIGHALVLRPSGSPPLVDNEDPSIPADLEATATSSSRIDLTWTASSDNVAVVEISRLPRDHARGRADEYGIHRSRAYSEHPVHLHGGCCGRGRQRVRSRALRTRRRPARPPRRPACSSSVRRRRRMVERRRSPSPGRRGLPPVSLLVASIDVAGASAPTTPDGWTLIESTTSSDGTLTKATYWRFASPGMPLSFAWSLGSARAASGDDGGVLGG